MRNLPIFHQQHKLEERILAQKWFYRFALSSGRVTDIYVADEVEHIHRTRRDMMLAELGPLFEANPGTLTAIDVASHQGWFSFELARHCRSVTGLEYQARHVERATLMAECLGANEPANGSWWRRGCSSRDRFG